jgi:hypothetical protein
VWLTSKEVGCVMNLKLFGFVALATTFISAAQAHAEPVVVSCADEDVIHAGWDSPLAVSYTGGQSGEISVKSEHMDLTVPASLSERSTEIDGAEVKAVDINGSAETAALMPDMEDLLACAARSVQPEFKDDADMVALALMSCAPQAKPGAEGVKIAATVRLGLLPGADGNATDVIVEIKRRYLDVKTPAGEDLVIETFPKDCKLATQL